MPGRPILYRCAPAALRILGISSLSELPPLPEGEELPPSDGVRAAASEDEP